MNCPFCQKLRYKREWTKSQWASECAHSNGYLGCRLCREARSKADISSTLTPEMTVQAEGLATCLDELTQLVSQDFQATKHWDEFMYKWEADKLRATRKELSQYGGLRCTYPWEPKQWTATAPGSTLKTVSYFNPQKDVYAYSIAHVFPSAESTARHNKEHLGDVVETLVGLCCFLHQNAGIVTLLTRASKYIYGLKMLLQLGSLHDSGSRRRLQEFVTRHSHFLHSTHLRDTSGYAESAPKIRPQIDSSLLQDREREYVETMLDGLYCCGPRLLAICDEPCDESVGEDAPGVCGEGADDAQEHDEISGDAEKRVSTICAGPVIFTMQDVAARSQTGGHKRATKEAHEKLKQMRQLHDCKLAVGSPTFEVDLSGEHWWKDWLASARFQEPVDTIIGDGVLRFVFEALSRPDPNTNQLRTDFTVVSRRHRVRLHPSSSGKEALPVYVNHDQSSLPRGTVEHVTRPRQHHIGISQAELLGQKRAWHWAYKQNAPMEITKQTSPEFHWEYWTCHAQWAQGLIVHNIGIAFTSEGRPLFWCAATRQDTPVYMEVTLVGCKTHAYQITKRMFEQSYAPLLSDRERTSFYGNSSSAFTSGSDTSLYTTDA